MKITSILTAAILILSLPLASTLQAAEWTSNYDAALKQAKLENKRVLIDFTGSDWCYWCKKMEADVLSKDEFKKYADEQLILVILDFPQNKAQSSELKNQNKKLSKAFDVDGFPTFVVLSPDGKEADRRSGYVRGGPQGFIQFLKVSEYTVKPNEKPAESAK